MPPQTNTKYARYVLCVLIIVYIFNFIDRQILSILAEDIKADLGMTDADIGFLYGTAFAVFYAIFGIPLGRLGDVWVRKSLISVGLTFWSLMTALSGTANSFLQLATYRIGVGVGEASASPAAFSMLSDYFSPHRRATVLALYSTGIYIGAGLGIFLGGWILDGWTSLYPDPDQAPFALRGWQVAFFIVGIPGILMALWVRTLREPERGSSEGISTPQEARPFRVFAQELMAILPPLTLLSLWRADASSSTLIKNLIMAVITALIAWLLIALTGHTIQWISLGVGVYASCSWVQKLSLTDVPAFTMIMRSMALRCCVPGFALIAFVTYGLGFWVAPFFIRVHGASVGEVGTYIGLSAAVGGLIGVAGGGFLADYLKQRIPAGRLYVGLISAVLSAVWALWLLSTDNITIAYAMNFLFSIFSPAWIGAATSTVNDLVLPRMRALASAVYILVLTLIGLALGPYSIGLFSDMLAPALGAERALTWAMMSALLALPLAAACLALGIRYLPQEESNKLERARLAGEPIAAV